MIPFSTFLSRPRVPGRFPRGLLLFILSPLAIVGQGTIADLPLNGASLEYGKALENSIAGGQKHAYRISLSPDEFASFTLEQRGIDVFIRVLDPNGKLIAEFDSEIRSQGMEKFDVAGLAGAAYGIEIEPRLKEAEKGSYQITWQERRPATENDRSLQEARVLAGESRALDRSAKYKEALALAEHVLEIRERILGPDDPEVGFILVRIGNLNNSLGDNVKAEALYRRAFGIYEAKLGPDHPKVAETLNNLAVLSRFRGDLAEAEQMFLRVLAIKEKAFGPNHPSLAPNLNNLGVIYRRRGDNIKAEAAYERALAIRERALGPAHPDLANVLTNLAALRFYNGDYIGAAAYDRRGLEIREKSFGPDHPSVAESLDNLANTYADSVELDKAKPLIERALQIREQKLGRDHIEVTYSLASLARLYIELGDLAKATPLFERAIQISEKSNARDGIDFSNLLYGFGTLLVFEGDYTQAESFLKRALEIRERISGADAHTVGRVCSELARMYALKGDAENALKFQLRSGRINEKNIEINLAVGTEHQKLSYMKLISDDLNQTIALSAGLTRDSAEARTLAATELIQRKGRVLDATAAGLAALRQRFDSQDRLLFDRLTDVNSNLAENILNRPGKMTVEAYEKLITDFKTKKDGLEKEIGLRNRGFYGKAPAVTVESLQAIIPPDAALVEFATYRPIARSLKAANSGVEPRYIAFVIRKSGVVGSAELGPAKEIDSAIEAFRLAVRDPNRKDVGKLAQGVDRKVMMPVRRLLGDASHLLISPDGELNLIPFEALVDEKGRNLIEDYSITYLTSGRDLVRMQIARDSKGQTAVVANPVFGEPDADQLLASVSPVKTRVRTSNRRSITNTRNLSDTYFAPLSGTAREASSIKTLFPEAKMLTGVAATETAVKELAAPKILHIATHGFFLHNGNPSADKAVAESAPSNITKIENPLLRSGLALAGANLRSGDKDDGILTALEASGLNLWGTKLVVLSACDTGLGEIRNGEGVYGLRRSFVIAGAESLVMSLWPVSDYVTRELMTNYYKNLKQGMGRGESLRQVQLDMIKRPNRRHPFYWASFIQSGDWANLDGKR